MSWSHYLETARGEFVAVLTDVESGELRSDHRGNSSGTLVVKPSSAADLDSLIHAVKCTGSVIVTTWDYKPVMRGTIDLDLCAYSMRHGTVTIRYATHPRDPDA